MHFQTRVQVRQKGCMPKIKFNYLNPLTQNFKPLNLSVNQSCQKFLIDGRDVPRNLRFTKTSKVQLQKRTRRNRIFDRLNNFQRSNCQNIVLGQRSMETRRRDIEGNLFRDNIPKKVRKSIFSLHNPNNKGFFTRNPSLISKAIQSSKNNKMKNYSKSHYFESQVYQLPKEPSLSNFLMDGTENNSQKESQQKEIHSQIQVNFSDQHILTARNTHDQGDSPLLLNSQRFYQKKESEQTEKIKEKNRQLIKSNQKPTISEQKSNCSNFFPFSMEVLIIFMGLSIFFLQIFK